MNVEELFTLALSFLSEKPQQNDLRSFIIPWVNLLLTEALPYENSVRLKLGRQPKLESAPILSDWQEEIPYCDDICRIAFPYGLASFIFQDDDNEYRTERYRNLYIAALQDAMKIQEEPIADLYGGDTDG